MLAVAAFSIVIALALHLVGDLVRGLALAALWVLPVLPVLVAWALVAELVRLAETGKNPR